MRPQTERALRCLSAGPVAQRPTADGEIPAGKAGSAGGLTPKLTPLADSDPEDARLLLLIQALSPRALERLRGLLATT